MRPRPRRSDTRGMALVFAVMVAGLLTALAVAAIAVAGPALQSSRFTGREVAMANEADGGLEIGRAMLNANPNLVPANLDSLIADTTFRLGQDPNVRRRIWVGRTGSKTAGNGLAGQYTSNLVSVVTTVVDSRGGTVARRLLLTQDSFSKFNVAINDWTNTGIAYGCGEGVQGPLHSNNRIVLQSGCTSPKVNFGGRVTLVNGSVTNQSSGNYSKGLKTGATAVNWPTAADTGRVRDLALSADNVTNQYVIDGDPSLTTTEPTVRIEFVPIDLDGDGQFQREEGFFRIYRAARTDADAASMQRAFVTAARWMHQVDSLSPGTTAAQQMGVGISTSGGFLGASGNRMNSSSFTNQSDSLQNGGSANCVARAGTTPQGNARYRTAAHAFVLTAGTSYTTRYRTAGGPRDILTAGTHRCYLGGDPLLFTDSTLFADKADTMYAKGVTPDSAHIQQAARTWFNISATAQPNFSLGWWQRRALTTNLPAALATVRPNDQQFFIPMASNPNFKGVLYVRGSVAISGKLRGRVTVAATGNIMIADDLTYVVAPGTVAPDGAQTCDEYTDMAGLYSQRNIFSEDNNLQTGMRVGASGYTGGGAQNGWLGGFDTDTPTSVNIHGFLLAMTYFGGDNPGWPTSISPGEQNPLNNQTCGPGPRGCIQVWGGMSIGSVNWVTYSGQGGWAENHTYDACGAQNPPPYFPTTGRFVQNRYYELDPVWMSQISVDSLFRLLQNGS